MRLRWLAWLAALGAGQSVEDLNYMDRRDDGSLGHEVIEREAEMDVWIDFGLGTPPEGFLADRGEPFDEQRSVDGLAFGWEADASSVMVDRGAVPAELGRVGNASVALGTFVQLGRTTMGVGTAWKMALVDGWYEVSFGVCDPAQDTVGGRLSIQGSVVLDAMARSPVDAFHDASAGLHAGDFRSGTEYVHVTGGFLTVGDRLGGDTAPLSYLRVQHHRVNDDPRTFFVGQINVPIAERGTNPDGSAKDEVPLIADCYALDRSEPSRVAITRNGRQYCQNDLQDGGWTLVMKVAEGSDVFSFGSEHWTNATVYNEDDRSLEPTDAKFAAFNDHEFTEWLAHFPDFESGGFWRIGPFDPITSLELFQTPQALSEDATSLSDWNANYFSSQPGIQRYGIAQTIGNSGVRWGYSWTQLSDPNAALDLSVQAYYSGFTSAAGGGIGLATSDLALRSAQSNRLLSAGDWFACPGAGAATCGQEATSPGLTRGSGQASYRAHIYGRASTPPSPAPVWVPINADETVSFDLHHYDQYAETGELYVRSCMVYSDFAGSGEVHIRLSHTTAPPCVDDPGGHLASVSFQCSSLQHLCGHGQQLSESPSTLPLYNSVFGGTGDYTIESVCPDTCDVCPTPGGDVLFEDVLPATSAVRRETEHNCGMWHVARNVECGSILGESCQLEVVHDADAQLYLYDYTLEVAVLDSTHHLQQFHVGRLDVRVSHDGIVGDVWKSVSEKSGFGLDLVTHYARYVEAPFAAFNNTVSFEEAEHECHEYGGHLASVHTDDELEALAAAIERAGLQEQQVLIGAAKNHTTGLWEFIDGTPYNEAYMSSRNFLAFGNSDIMSMVVYPDWNELFGSPVSSMSMPDLPFACSRTSWTGTLRLRACAVFSETTGSGGNITLRLRKTDEARRVDESSAVFMEDTFMSSPSQHGVVHMQCGAWYDAASINCGNTIGTACQVDMMHSSSVSAVKLYEYGFEVAVDEAAFHTTTHYSGRISIPVASQQVFNYSAANGEWMHIGARDGMGFSLPAYSPYGAQNDEAQLIRFCAVYTDNAEGGTVSLQLRGTDAAGGEVFVESVVGSATRSVGELLRTGCGAWETLGSVSCDSASGCQIYLKHSNDTSHWQDSRRDREIRVYSVDIEVASCYAGFSLIDGDCVPNVCTEGLTLANSDTVCSGSTGDGCIYFCHEGYHYHHKHECMFNGAFEGGECLINLCRNWTVPHSSTTCSGYFGDVCVPECDQGYTLYGSIVCERTQLFEGGYCAPDYCDENNQIQASSTYCQGYTGQTCDFQCNPGWTKRGTHQCMTTGRWDGGHCDINPCMSGHTLEHSPTYCTGDTGFTCNYQCRAGYRREGTHQCQPDGQFRGGQCVLDHPCNVERGTIGADDCHADARCERTAPGEYDCICNAEVYTESEEGYLFGVPIGGFHGTGQDCDPWRECEALISYETSPPTDEQDRICTDLTLCAVGEYEVNASTYTTDRDCETCPPGTFQPVAKQLGQPNDQVCTPCPHGWTDDDSDPATPCRRCSVGTYQPDEGAFGPIAGFACQIHTADLDRNALTPCEECPPGFMASGMSTVCEPISCRPLQLRFSNTPCEGNTNDQCMYACNEGYTVQGNLTCMPGANRMQGRFEGGECTPNECVGGLDLPNALDMSSCRHMVTEDVCTFECETGYTPSGEHKCLDTGMFGGGTCAPDPCTPWGDTNDPTTGTICTGNTGEFCEIECRPGYISAAMELTPRGYDNNLTRAESMVLRARPEMAYDAVTTKYRCSEDGIFRGGTPCVPRGCYGVEHTLEISSNMGSCRSSGILLHGETCDFGCEGDLDLLGPSMRCSFGNLSEPQKCRVTWDYEGMQRNRYIMYALFGVTGCILLGVGCYALLGGRKVVKANKQGKIDYDAFKFAEDDSHLKDNPLHKDVTVENWLFKDVGIKPDIVSQFVKEMQNDPVFQIQNPDNLEFSPVEYVSELFGAKQEENRGSFINNLKLMDWGIDNTAARAKIIAALKTLKLKAHQKIVSDMMKEYDGGEAERPIVGEMVTLIPEWLTTVVKLEPLLVDQINSGFESIGAYNLGDLIDAVPIDGMTDLRLQEAGVTSAKDRKNFVKQVKALKLSVDRQIVKRLMNELADVEFDSNVANPLAAGPRLTYATGPLDEVLTEIRDIFKSHKVDLRDAFAAFDVDGDGVVTVEEFRSGLSAMNMPLSMDQADQLMTYFDKDNSGEIDVAEFVKQFGDDVKAERHAETMAKMAAHQEGHEDAAEQVKKQARAAVKMEQRKFAKLKEFVEASTAKKSTKTLLLKYVQTRQELASLTRANISAMNIQEQDQFELVLQLQQQAELHFKKKAALDDQYHSSEEERLSDEEDLTEDAEEGRRNYEQQQRIKEMTELGGDSIDPPQVLVAKYLEDQRPAQIRELCAARDLPTKGVSRVLKDRLTPVLLEDGAFVQQLQKQARNDVANSDTSESEDSDVEGSAEAQQLILQGESAMAAEDFQTAVDAFEKALSIDNSDPTLKRKVSQAKTNLQRKQNSDRIKAAQEARDRDKASREEAKAEKAAEAAAAKDMEKQRMALVHKGEAAIRAEDYELAIQLFEEGLLIDPDEAAAKPTPGSRQLANGLKKAHAKIGGSILKDAKKLVSDAEGQMRQRNFDAAIAIYNQANAIEIDADSAAGKEHHHMMDDKLEKAVTAKRIHQEAQAIYAQAQAASAAGNADSAIELFTAGSAKLQENVYAQTDHEIRDGCRKGAAAEKQKKATAARMVARGEIVVPSPIAPAVSGDAVASRSLLQESGGFEASDDQAKAQLYVEHLRPAELRKMLTARGLEAKGLKKDLIARLTPALASDAVFMATLNPDGTVQEPEPEPAPATVEPSSADVAMVDGYIEPLRPADLRSQLEERGLDKKGLKKDLQARLKESLLADQQWLTARRAAEYESEDV